MGCCTEKNNKERNKDGELPEGVESCSAFPCCSLRGRRCMCTPYDDVFVTASAILSFVAFLISWVWWITFVISFIGMLLFQFLYCCRHTKCSIYASTAVAAVSSLASFGVGIFVLVGWKNTKLCYAVLLWGEGTVDEALVDTGLLGSIRLIEEGEDWCPEKRWGTMAILCGAVWLAAAGCLFYFAKSGRHATWEEHHSKTAAAETNAEDVVAVEMGTVSAASTIAPTIVVSDAPSKLDVTD